MTEADRRDPHIALAIRLAGEAAAEISDSPFVRATSGKPVERLPDLGIANAERRSTLGKDLLRRADRIDESALPHDLALTVGVVRETAQRWAREAEWWWLVHDPMGVGFFGLFGPTAYCGAYVLSGPMQMAPRFGFDRRGDLYRYLGIVEDFALQIDRMRERLEGQAARGIIMPRPQLEQARPLIEGLRAAARRAFLQPPERLNGLDPRGRFAAALSEVLEQRLDPAFAALRAALEGDYAARASETVGIGQYPGGDDIYRALVRLHTTLDLTPREVHERGLARMAEIRQGMAQIRAETGFSGDDHAYQAAVAENPRWRAGDAAGVQAVFRRYVERIKPLLDSQFRFRPKSACDAEALPETLAGSMTFGYYQGPQFEGDIGRYLFNAGNLTKAALNNIGALNYHELEPGHHFHLATQSENETLHPVRTHSFFNAFNEGWAEYAAVLAGELGMYAEPEERFGHRLMQAFLTCRLVVDTGMNAFGWSLEQARSYMRENAFMSESEIATESLRYSCDIPAQSLAYKLGDTHILNERARMRAALGDRFDIRDFHDAVLAPGALPLPLVTRNVDRAIARGRDA